MTHPLQAVIASKPRMLPQLYAPTAQNDNDHPRSPAAAQALRRPCPRIAAAGWSDQADLRRRA